jgi:ABC-type uncharacterized transport system ATPase subunit
MPARRSSSSPTSCNEILEIADRISVLRGGRSLAKATRSRRHRAELAEMMVGRPVQFRCGEDAVQPGETLAEIDDLTVLRENDDIAVDDVSFSVRSGEVVGIAGVQGNGQSALSRPSPGLREPPKAGSAFLAATSPTPMCATRHVMGMAHIPEDRQRAGLMIPLHHCRKHGAHSYYGDPFSRGPQINWPKVLKTWAASMRSISTCARPRLPQAGHLSGGNQQKMIVARELSRDTKLVVAAQPTRGLDVGSIEYIHSRLMAARDEGDGVLIVSSELDEILLCPTASW